MVLVWRRGNLQLLTGYATEVPWFGLDHRHRHWHTGHCLLVHQRHVVEHNLRPTGVGRVRGGGGSFNLSALPAASGTLLAGHIFFGETLLLGFGLPIVVLYPSAVDNDACSKLPEHRPGSHDRDLSRAIRVRQDFLTDQLIFLWLSGDDLEERSILVEQKIRVSIVQNPCAFRCQHEQLLAPIWDEEDPHSVLSIVHQMALRIDLFLSCLIELSRHIFVALLGQDIGGMISYRRQRFEDRLRGRCLRRGCFRRGGLSLLRQEGRLGHGGP